MARKTGCDISNTLKQSVGESTGHRYWRTLEELAGTEEFQQFVEREFPDAASEWNDSFSRRKFLTLMGASLALAGVSGCSHPPREKIVPFVRQPEGVIPGLPQYFASASPRYDGAIGVLVESHLGRPTKIEGNPEHPASLGATDAIAQAEILTLYDPDRSKTVLRNGRISTWVEAETALRGAMRLASLGSKSGDGLQILSGRINSPMLQSQRTEFLKKFPNARWVEFEPTESGASLDGMQIAFGERVQPIHHFESADVIVSFDADFLARGPAHLLYTREFSRKRKVWDAKEPRKTSKLYCCESELTITGAKGDDRVSVRPSEIRAMALALARELNVALPAAINFEVSSAQRRWIHSVAGDLRQHQGRSIVVAGEFQSKEVHAIVHAINESLKNHGATIHFSEPLHAVPSPNEMSLAELCREMAEGRVASLIILGGNPAYDAPSDFDFAANLQRISFSAHVGLYANETAAFCKWHLPENHWLESWGDTRAFNGLASIIQPLIAPLYSGKTLSEVVAILAGDPPISAYEMVRTYWRKQWNVAGEAQFEDRWQTSLHAGVIAGTEFARKQVTWNAKWFDSPELSKNEARPAAESLELVIRPDLAIQDGRNANNGWLQELPNPITKLTWGNAALMSPRTAANLRVTNPLGRHGGAHGEVIADVIRLTVGETNLEIPAFIVPAIAENTIVVTLGYGRKNAGRVGSNIGINAFGLRNSRDAWNFKVEVQKTNKTSLLACTQHHYLMEGRDLVRSRSLMSLSEPGKQDQQTHSARLAEASKHLPVLSLHPPHAYEGYKWGMAIDLTSCTGCSACVVACQSENNIPIVGKEEVMRGREMHWLRIDRYYEGEAEQPQAVHFQPVPCMHCENAPCEVVCPVGATVHSDEGLNDMVYNRCVGTRYCSNNCPYKVRRFNFLQYADFTTESYKLMHNPDVTVRTRGVMEKCTYCVQRISGAKRESEKQNRPINDGEILTACQAVCPAEAIVFGNLNDPDSQVSKMKRSPLNYGLLAELNTQPRTTYLESVRNIDSASSRKGS